jgi:hypothetical protein
MPPAFFEEVGDLSTEPDSDFERWSILQPEGVPERTAERPCGGNFDRASFHIDGGFDDALHGEQSLRPLSMGITCQVQAKIKEHEAIGLDAMGHSLFVAAGSVQNGHGALEQKRLL